MHITYFYLTNASLFIAKTRAIALRSRPAAALFKIGYAQIIPPPSLKFQAVSNGNAFALQIFTRGLTHKSAMSIHYHSKLLVSRTLQMSLYNSIVSYYI